MADKKVPNLKAKYQAEVAPALMQKFGYKSVMQIPKIDKIVVDYGICRICFRELAYKGQIPGVKKASW